MKFIYLIFLLVFFTKCKSKKEQPTVPLIETTINNSSKEDTIIAFDPLSQLGQFTRSNHNIPISDKNTLLPPKPNIKFLTTPNASTYQAQYLQVDATKDNVVEGDKGTIIVCPKDCFIDANGNIVNENITIELKEAFSLSDMLLNNLSTTSNGNLLETDGMIYINPTSNGEQLHINKDIPIHIEIPSKKKLAGMMAYKGVNDSTGKINWIDPKKIENYLMPVDFNLLDFLPKGFAGAVQKNIPYKNHDKATPQLIDSLYYSLSVMDGSELIKGFNSTNVNEAYYNKNSKVVNGKYDTQSFEIKSNRDTLPLEIDRINEGIDPAIIKLIKTAPYQNTFLATREFENRMPSIFKTCNAEVIKFYVKNTNKNLYEVDAMAANLLQGTEFSKDFDAFKNLKETNVKDGDKNYLILQNYYEVQLKNIKNDLENLKQQLLIELNKKNAAFEKIKKEYETVLWKREKYRMEKYGFDWTSIGWINVDRGTIPKDWGPKRLEILVENNAEFEELYSYVVYSTIKSIYRLNTIDNKLFYVGNVDEKQMLMPKNKKAYSITIGYKNKITYAAIKEFETGSIERININLALIAKDEIDALLKKYDSYSDENKISKDLEYMALFQKEKKRQKDLLNESQFIYELWHISYPCKLIEERAEVQNYK